MDILVDGNTITRLLGLDQCAYITGHCTQSVNMSTLFALIRRDLIEGFDEDWNSINYKIKS